MQTRIPSNWFEKTARDRHGLGAVEVGAGLMKFYEISCIEGRGLLYKGRP